MAEAKKNTKYRLQIFRHHVLTICLNEYFDITFKEKSEKYLNKWIQCSEDSRNIRQGKVMIHYTPEDWAALYDNASKSAKITPNSAWNKPMMDIARAAFYLEALSKKSIIN